MSSGEQIVRRHDHFKRNTCFYGIDTKRSIRPTQRTIQKYSGQPDQSSMTIHVVFLLDDANNLSKLNSSLINLAYLSLSDKYHLCILMCKGSFSTNSFLSPS